MESNFTAFAPARRAAPGIVERQNRAILNTTLFSQLYDAVAEIILILNRERQIVFCNQNLADLLGLSDRSTIYGLRPGEALGCLHAFDHKGGCGTTEFCSTCGAVNAILASQWGRRGMKECRILRDRSGEAFDLQVKTSPLRLQGEEFTIVAITDISHEKRRAALERIFFHDVLNTASGIKLYCELLNMEQQQGQKEEIERTIFRAAVRLIEEINSQRDLLSAETNRLSVTVETISSLSLLKALVDSFLHRGDAAGCLLEISPRSEEIQFENDRTLLSRVLTNMVRNAVEACDSGDTVTVGCEGGSGGVKFWVRNPSVMEKDVQLQLFKRSFSTKGEGRGLGTYSMKLLSERYLKGSIGFESSEEEGTVFTAFYPLRLE